MAELTRDPAQRAVDPRLWLVLAPPLPSQLEAAFLPTFLRAEPFARVARVPGTEVPLATWLAREVDLLTAGEDLATAGLVVDLDGDEMPAFTDRDEKGNLRTSSRLFDLVAGLEDLYATKEILGPGEVYNRLHSHTGSEELYIVLEGEGKIRVNERVVPIRAGQCFGKPRGYDCATQLMNTGASPMVFLDIGTVNAIDVDLGRYHEHGEILVRLGNLRFLVPTETVIPAAELGPVYDRRYYRSTGR